MAERAKRHSNIELLRIAAAAGVVILHYNNPGIGGGFAAVKDGSLNQFVMVSFEAVFICAVNLFVLITGYFLRNTSRRDLLKPVKLLTMYAAFELAACLINELPKGGPISLSTFFSYFTPSYWFVFVYVALYLISPFINMMWDHLSRSGKITLLVLSIVLFSVYPTIWETVTFLSGTRIWGEDKISFYGISQGVSPLGLFGSGAGYTIVNFVLLYLIGCYLRDREDDGVRTGSGKLLILLLLNVLVIIGWTYAEFAVSGAPINATTGWNYENPFVISEAVLVFLVFQNMKPGNNRVINALAAAAFPTYLIHMNILGYFRITDFVKAGTPILILHILCSAAVIYLLSFVICKLYDLITEPVFKRISGKWKRKRFIVIRDGKDPDQMGDAPPTR